MTTRQRKVPTPKAPSKLTETIPDDGPSDPTIEDLTYLLTILLKQVNQAIDEETTFDLLREMFAKELDTAGVRRYGKLIRHTSAAAKTNGVQ